MKLTKRYNRFFYDISVNRAHSVIAYAGLKNIFLETKNTLIKLKNDKLVKTDDHFRHVLFSQDQNLLIGANFDSIFVWNIMNNEIISHYIGDDMILDVSECKSEIIAVIMIDDLFLGSITQLNPVRMKFQEGNTETEIAKISPNHQVVASDEYNKISLWDPKKSQRNGILKGHNSGIGEISFDYSSKFLISSAENVRIWDIAMSSTISIIPAYGGALFHPFMTYIVTYSDSILHLWDLNTSKCFLELKLHDDKKKHNRTCWKFDYLGHYLLLTFDDQEVQIYRIPDIFPQFFPSDIFLCTSIPIESVFFENMDCIATLSFLKSDKFNIVVQKWDFITRTQQNTMNYTLKLPIDPKLTKYPIFNQGLSLCGYYTVALNEVIIHSWNFRTNKKFRINLAGKRVRMHFHPTQPLLWAVSEIEHAKILNCSSGTIYEMHISEQISHATFDLEMPLLYLGTSKGQTFMWNFETKQTNLILNGLEEPIQDYILDPTGKTFGIIYSTSVVIYDKTTFEEWVRFPILPQYYTSLLVPVFPRMLLISCMGSLQVRNCLSGEILAQFSPVSLKKIYFNPKFGKVVGISTEGRLVLFDLTEFMTTIPDNAELSKDWFFDQISALTLGENAQVDILSTPRFLNAPSLQEEFFTTLYHPPQMDAFWQFVHLRGAAHLPEIPVEWTACCYYVSSPDDLTTRQHLPTITPISALYPDLTFQITLIGIPFYLHSLVAGVTLTFESANRKPFSLTLNDFRFQAHPEHPIAEYQKITTITFPFSLEEIPITLVRITPLYHTELVPDAKDVQIADLKQQVSDLKQGLEHSSSSSMSGSALKPLLGNPDPAICVAIFNAFQRAFRSPTPFTLHFDSQQ